MEKGKIAPGTAFGRWTVLEAVEQSQRGERKWLCRCQCGTERSVLERSLLYGGSVSCGCLRKERCREAISPDLTGKQFGELTVLRRLENAKSGAARWLCQCSCGEQYETFGSLLTTGRRTRCSSKAHAKNYRYVDITGQRFARLVALYPSKRNDKSGSVIWRCRCDCGNEVDVSYNALAFCNQKSCGCQKKEHDQKLGTYLTRVAGTSVDILKSKKVPRDNTTGYKGVYFIKGKYVAKIVFQKKAYYLGTFAHITQAAEARREAEELLFDGAAEHYEKWKQRAEGDPVWAKENPIQIQVSQKEDGRLSVQLLPVLPEPESHRRRAQIRGLPDQQQPEL